MADETASASATPASVVTPAATPEAHRVVLLGPWMQNSFRVGNVTLRLNQVTLVNDADLQSVLDASHRYGLSLKVDSE